MYVTYAQTGVAACTLAMGGGGYGSWVVATEWNSMELHLKVVWPSGADIPQVEIYMYIYIYIHMYVYIYIYIHI